MPILRRQDAYTRLSDYTRVGAFICAVSVRDVWKHIAAHDEIIERLQAVSSRRAEPKNRVLTLEELKAYCTEGADAAPLWYDSKDYSDVNRWMVIDLPKHAFGSAATVNCFVNGHFFEPTYGEEWRCWLKKPTEAERRETSWG